MRGRRGMPNKDEDKFRGGRGSEVKKKGQKWKMEGKSIKKQKHVLYVVQIHERAEDSDRNKKD